jgi:hypothetical protein
MRRFSIALAAAFSFVSLSCGTKTVSADNVIVADTASNSEKSAAGFPVQLAAKDLETELAAIAEAERSRSYQTGLGINESGIRESAGDYAGAVIAAYKDLCWTYSYSSNGKESAASIKNGLEKIKALYRDEKTSGIPDKDREAAIAAADATIDFIEERFESALKKLEMLFANDKEPDSFSRWMRLVCAMESGVATNAEVSFYSAIRARYEILPAYWYFGARHIKYGAATGFAERCINLAPEGPYSSGARAILAEASGLKQENAKSIRSKNEIDEFISRAVNNNDPSCLSELLPLISLADNPYTLYATGMLRSLAARAPFNEWFNMQEKLVSKQDSRLADRIRYITRG